MYHQAEVTNTAQTMPDELEQTWRSYAEETSNLTVLSILDIFESTAEITNLELSEDLGDVELTAMDTRERPALEKLRKELEKKVQHLPAGHGDLQRHAVSAFKAGSQWLKDLQALVKQRNLHLTPDHKYAKPLELEKFKGRKNKCV